MDGTNRKTRRHYVWPAETKNLIQNFFQSGGDENKIRSVAALISQLVTLTGYPRDACLRYAHSAGIQATHKHRPWTKPEQQRLFDLTEICPVEEAARVLRRSPSAVRSMLHRLGESSQRGRDWFTPYSLAEVLHTRVDEVQGWITKDYLKCRVVETGTGKKRIIDPDDFTDFVRNYGSAVVGRRLNKDRLLFLQNFVFPAKHAHLLPLRKSGEEKAGDL